MAEMPMRRETPATIREVCARACEQIAVWVADPASTPVGERGSVFFLGFPVGSTALGAEQQQVIQEMAKAACARSTTARPWLLSVTGRASAPGSTAVNAGLAQGRADNVLQAFRDAGWPADRLNATEAVGLGEHDPLIDVGEVEHPANRSVEVEFAYPDPFPPIDPAMQHPDHRPAANFEIQLSERVAVSYRWAHFDLFHGFVRPIVAADGSVLAPRHLFVLAGCVGLSKSGLRLARLPDKILPQASGWARKAIDTVWSLVRRDANVAWEHDLTAARAGVPEAVDYGNATISDVPMSLAQLDGCLVTISVPFSVAVGPLAAGGLRLVFDPLGAAHELWLWSGSGAASTTLLGAEVLGSGIGKTYVGGLYDPNDPLAIHNYLTRVLTR